MTWLQLVQIAGAVGMVASVIISILAYRRQGSWRSHDDDREGKRQTEIKITQIDEHARQGVTDLDCKVDSEVDRIMSQMAAGDSETRQSLQRIESGLRRDLESQGKQVATIQERLGHLPTHADFAAVNKSIGELATGVARVEGAVGKGEALQVRIEKTLERLEDGLLHRR